MPEVKREVFMGAVVLIEHQDDILVAKGTQCIT